jgi:hypothetical protein
MLSTRTPFLLLIVAVAVLGAACGTSPTAPAEPWRVSVTSSGGLAGHGMGSYSIGSDGVVRVTNMTGKTCTFTATPAEVARIGQLVSASEASRWRQSYLPEDTCCDRIEWTLSVDGGGRTVSTKWLDREGPLPADLTALADALAGGTASLRTTYEPRCR